MKYLPVSRLYEDTAAYAQQRVCIGGWIRTLRDSKHIAFLELHDGSCFRTMQAVLEDGVTEGFAEAVKWPAGTAVSLEGEVVLTPDARQPFELKVMSAVLEATCPTDYPLQKKRHSLEFLRGLAHLRPRTNTFQAVFRIRSAAAFAIHEFFQQHGFIYVHTPIITTSDCEGAGEMFRVTTLDALGPPLTADGRVDFAQDFFGKGAALTVSGQLNGESFALAMRNIYTFGPTFRAENSNTARHAAEFWMIEPEMAFADLGDDMRVAEAMVKHVLCSVMTRCPDEMAFCQQHYDTGLLARLSRIVEADFARVSYTEAIGLLTSSGQRFTYPVAWGSDLQTEHERYLSETVFQRPVFVTDYPQAIKAFYMRANDDGKTVAAMDLLVPGVGEIIGGSQREERCDRLVERIRAMHLDEEAYRWYTDLRRYGGVKHAGFGLGFERILMYMTGIANIRDVIPFPRTVHTAEF